MHLDRSMRMEDILGVGAEVSNSPAGILFPNIHRRLLREPSDFTRYAHFVGTKTALRGMACTGRMAMAFLSVMAFHSLSSDASHLSLNAAVAFRISPCDLGGKIRLIRGPAMRRIQKNVPLKEAARTPIPQP